MIPTRDYEIVYQETNDEGRFVVIKFSFHGYWGNPFPEELFVLITYPVRDAKIIFNGRNVNVPANEYDDVFILYKSYGDNVVRIAIGMTDQIKKDKKYSSKLS